MVQEREVSLITEKFVQTIEGPVRPILGSEIKKREEGDVYVAWRGWQTDLTVRTLKEAKEVRKLWKNEFWDPIWLRNVALGALSIYYWACQENDSEQDIPAPNTVITSDLEKFIQQSAINLVRPNI